MSIFDTDRSQVRCWHGNLLLECEDPEHSTPKATASRRDRFCTVTVIYYQGQGRFTVPVTDKADSMYGGESIHEVGPCEHRHTTIEAAERCGTRMTDKAVAAWNKKHGVA